jgi:hypothetical protein
MIHNWWEAHQLEFVIAGVVLLIAIIAATIMYLKARRNGR